MHFVIMVLDIGAVKEFRSVNENEVKQVFNSWRDERHLWAYIAKGDDFTGITYSERQPANRETTE